MNMQVLKPILVGLIAGAALFWMPFLVIKIVVVLLILGLLFRLFGRKRHYGHGRWAMADRIRSMSDAEYGDFKSLTGPGCGYWKDETPKESTS